MVRRRAQILALSLLSLIKRGLTHRRRAFSFFFAVDVSWTWCIHVNSLSRSSRRCFRSRTLWSSTWRALSEAMMEPGRSLAPKSRDAGSLHPRISSPSNTRGLPFVVSRCPVKLRPRNVRCYRLLAMFSEVPERVSGWISAGGQRVHCPKRRRQMHLQESLLCLSY